MEWTSKLLMVGFVVLVSGALFIDKALAGGEGHLNVDTAAGMELSQFGEPVSGEVLESLSGGQSMSTDTIDILASNMKLDADMKDNLLYSTNTGFNQVSSDAFGNAGGIFTVVQNSGNQVIINNALILNLQIQ